MGSASSIPPAELGPDIQRFLGAFAARKRWVESLAALGWTIALALAWMLLQCLIDRWAGLPTWARLTLLAVGAALAIAPLLGQFLRLRRPVDWQQIAAQIERRDPDFQQRLETLTSQFYFPPALRGSAEMLDQLRSEVAQQTRLRRPTALVDWKESRAPWLAVVAFVLLGLILWNVNYLQLPQLLRRALQATAPLPAVSVTQLEVAPGSADVLQGSAMTIRVVARRLGQRPVRLYLGGGSGTFSEVEMPRQAAADGAQVFSFTLGGVDRDLRYYAEGGDAVSRIYNIRVQRVPKVAQYQIVYHYPPAVRRPAQSVESADGRLEAPVGSSAEVSMSVTEALRSVWVKVEGRNLPLEGAGGNVWKITLPIASDMNCPLELTSTQGVLSSGLSLSIRAIVDHPPLVRLFGGSGDLLLEGRQVLRLRFEAVDEYEVDKLELRIAGAGAEIFQPLPLASPRPRVEGTVDVDLANLHVNVGDVVRVWVGAEDSAQQWGWSSGSRNILVVEHGLGLSHWQCVAELKTAAGFAADWAGALERARQAWETLLEADPASSNRWALLVSAQHASTDAADLGADLRLALLRALWQSQIADGETPLPAPTDLAGQSEGWPDAALGNVLAQDADLSLVIGADITTSRDAESPSLLVVSGTQARALGQQLTTLWQGQAAIVAATLRSDLAALGGKSVTTGPGPGEPSRAATRDSAGAALKNAERKAQALSQAHQTLDVLLADLGLIPAAGDLDDALAQRRATASALAANQRSKDWIAVVGQWDAHNDPGGATLLGQRLELAAQTQALRAELPAQLVWACDLHRAGRALVILQKSEANQSALLSAAAQLPGLLDVLRQEDYANSSASAASAAAADARKRLDAWASHPSETGEQNHAAARSIGGLIFDANAASALGDSVRADALDKDLLDALAAAAPDEAARLKPAFLQRQTELAGQDRAIQRQEELMRQNTRTAEGVSLRFTRDELVRTRKGMLLRLARVRLQMMPSLAAVFAPADEEPTARVLAASFLRSAAGARGGHATTLPQSEAPAYQDAVRAYFDALAHSRDEKPKR